jgi:hypothetical protein
MGLDLYVGPLTRYYAGDWETIVQQAGREAGMEVIVLRGGEPGDSDEEFDEIHSTVLAWRDALARELRESAGVELDWREDPDAPYFTDKPTWDCYSSLLLWAAYEEHPELARPAEHVEDWGKDRAFQANYESRNTRYPHLLLDTEFWLPADFPFTFEGADPMDKDLVFGSSPRLLSELEQLNERTWRADDRAIKEWRAGSAEYRAPLEEGARFAFAVFYELAQESVRHRLPMKLDY